MSENELNLTVTPMGAPSPTETPQMRVVDLAPPTIVTQEPPVTPEVPVVEAEPTQPVQGTEFKPELVFGQEYDNLDKVKEAIASAKELKAKVAEYETKLKQTTVEDPYIKSLIEWSKQGKSKDTHDLVYYSDPSKLDLAQKVALQLQIETGLSPEKAMKVVNHKYKLGEDYDVEDPDVDIARTMLEVDANKAHSMIEQFRAKESAQIPSFDYVAQVKSWEPQILSTVESFKELEISPGVKYPVRAETLQEARQHLESVLLSDGVEMDHKDPEQQKVAQGIMSNYIKAKEMDSILKFHQTEWEKKQIREKSNIPVDAPVKPLSPTVGEHDWMQTAKPFRL